VSSFESPEAAHAPVECVEAEEKSLLPREEPRPEPLPELPLLIPDWVVDPNAPAGPDFRQELLASLSALCHARAPIERLLGRGLALFRDRRFDTMDVGERNFVTLAHGRLEINRTDAYQLARLGKELDYYPVVAGAFHAGELSRSHVVALLQVMVIDTEKGWVEHARGKTVRELKAEVGRFLEDRGRVPEDDPDDNVRVPVRMPGRVWHFLKNVGKGIVEKVNGHELPLWRVMETLCAEASAELGDLVPGEEMWGLSDPHPSGAGTPADARMPRMEVEAPDEDGLYAAGRREWDDPLVHAMSDEDRAFMDSLPNPRTARSSHELLDMLLELMALKRSLDWQMGRVLAYGRGHAQLFDPQKELGISEKWERDLRSLDVRLEELPALREAYRRGRIGWAKTWQLTRVCEAETEEAWLERAGNLTVRGLKTQVSAMEDLRELSRVDWRRLTGGLPPSDELLEGLKVLPEGYKAADWDALERAGRVAPGGYPPGAPTDPDVRD